MKQKPAERSASSERIIRDIKRKTRKQYSAEEKIRIVLDGLRGEGSIAELCRRVHKAAGEQPRWQEPAPGDPEYMVPDMPMSTEHAKLHGI